jgi:hypothetical protein
MPLISLFFPLSNRYFAFMQPHKYMGKNETDLGACICTNHATVLLKKAATEYIHIFNRLTKF